MCDALLEERFIPKILTVDRKNKEVLNVKVTKFVEEALKVIERVGENTKQKGWPSSEYFLYSEK